VEGDALASATGCAMAGCSCGAPIRLALSQIEQIKVTTKIARTSILLKVPEGLAVEPDRRNTAR
jgi:hypothetical protein